MAKSFVELEKSIAKALDGIVSQSFLKVFAERARELIYRRTKSGKGVKNGTESQLKPLSKSYVEQRKGTRVFFTDPQGQLRTFKPKRPKPLKLGEFGSPGKSNLTLSGEMLDSIQIKMERFGFLLYFPDTKHKYSKRVTVREVAQFVQKQGRPFFDFSAGERRVLLKLVQDEVRKKLRLLK